MSTTSEQNNCDVHLHTEMEVEVLKQALVEKQNQLIAMETACLRESDRQVELEDSIIAWQDKYDRLYDSHKRVQKVNQSLEDKLLKLVDRNSGERAQLTSDVATLSVRLAQANYNIAKLQREIERYKTDINLAIQLLQCKPDSFVPQKVSSLPMEIQQKVSSYMRLETNSHSDSEEGSTSGVGMATSGSYKVLPASDSPPPGCPFPPTAMVYSMRGLDHQLSTNSTNSVGCTNNSNNNNNGTEQMLSPSIMAKFLEEELKASEVKHCDTCQCSTKDLTVLADISKTYAVSTQTVIQGDGNSSLCLRCNSNLNSPSRTNSPYLMKMVKSSDSVISETKSSVSDLNDIDKLFTPVKKDDLMVNPILGHHRLCDRTSNNKISSMGLQQQQQYNETAKYIMDSSRDIFDLGAKYCVKSPLSVTSSAGRHRPTTANSDSRKKFASIAEQHDSSRTSDINLLVDNSDCSPGGGKGADSIQGKNADEERVAGACGNEKNNLQSTVSGSVSSLWSKTSSGEGAKMFETFNRNLIKTIKAENPKYRGPRLCALRIQNGSSNILLDNIESTETTPIIYTRRQRFLDEELDDTKDIITSKSSTKLDDVIVVAATISEEPEVVTAAAEPPPNCSTPQSASNQTAINNNNNIINQNDISNDRKLTNSFLEQQIKQLVTSEQEQQLFKASLNYDLLNFNESQHTNSKSCTQSSSISDVIDMEETAMLRRQQLSRVAEWVHNNSQIELQQRYAAESAYDVTPTKPTTTDDESARSVASQLNSDSIAQNQFILSYKYYQESSKAAAQQPASHVPQNHHAHQVDLAQMEYNVKQFLLKQNEWSMRSSNAVSTTSSNLSHTPAGPVTPQLVSCSSSSKKNNYLNNIIKCTTTNGGDVGVLDCSSVSGGGVGGGGDPIPNFKSHPHRTETNL